jgi:hypothetical protein
MAAMTAPENVAAFGEYVRVEGELAEVLERRLRQDRAMVQ